MKCKTKDLVITYTGFILFTVLLLTTLFFIKWFQNVVTPTNISEEEIPIVYDTPVQYPADNVQQITMLPNYPSGDEFATAVCFLKAYGYDVDIQTLITYMNYDDNNFLKCYVGNPTTNTGYCYAPALVVCMNNYLYQIDAQLRTRNMSEISLSDFITYVNDRHPIIIWYTIDNQEPQYIENIYYNGRIQMYQNEQVVLVYKIQNDVVSIIDPIEGQLEVPIEDFQHIWESCGSQAIGIYYVN